MSKQKERANIVKMLALQLPFFVRKQNLYAKSLPLIYYRSNRISKLFCEDKRNDLIVQVKTSSDICELSGDIDVSRV